MTRYQKALAVITDRRRTELDDAHMRWQAALNADDKLYAAFVAYQNEMIEAAKHKPNKLSATRAALSAQMRRMGIQKSDFEPAPHCPLCNDTGYVGGKYCKCVISAAAALGALPENLLPPVDFAAAKKTAPKEMTEVYAAGQTLIDEYPDCKKPFMNIIGASGSGKTYFAAAVAAALTEKGATVIALTTFDFVRRALDYHTQFKIDDYVDRFTPTIDCDVLVLDDLGKETMLKNVTLEYLYAVINERWLRRKVTIVTSNLSPSDILSRYGEAITSRLLDKNLASNFAVEGKNKRI